jgi:dolichol-phosphate mannosyltransferase
MDSPRYSFVVPVYNEQETLPELRERLTAVLDRLDGPAEVILVDDGSADTSFDLISRFNRDDPRFKALRFSRNFGHQIAITAGVDFASGDAVIILDADLQDPPEVALDLVERWKEGFEVVYAARADRSADPLPKRLLARSFYRVLGRMTDVEMPEDVGDFRLVDRRALNEFTAMRESNRYVRGMFSWIGFRQTGVPYTRPERFAGETKYPLRRSLKLGIDGVVSFSNVPLRAALSLGFVVSIFSFALGAAAVVGKLFGVYNAIPGWASVVVGMSFLGGVQLVVIGTMGLYVARIYDEVRGRPLYIVRDVQGFASEAARDVPRARVAVVPPASGR